MSQQQHSSRPRVCQRPSCSLPHRSLWNRTEVRVGHAKLFPCGHVYCDRCFTERLARRKCFMICDCDTIVTSHDYYTIGDINPTHCEHREPDTVKDPYRRSFQEFFLQKTKPSARLSLTFLDKNNQLQVVTLSVDNMNAPPDTDIGKKKLLVILSMLHPMVMVDACVDDGSKPTECLSPMDLFQFALKEDKRFLSKCIYSIATGNLSFNVQELENNPSFQSRFLASFCASELLARINSKHPQRLQLMISEQLSLNAVERETWRVFSRFRLCADEKTSETASVKKLSQKAGMGVTVNPMELVVWIMDNLGFRMKVGYDQWTVILAIVIGVEELKSIGLYSNGRGSDNALSREPSNNWDELLGVLGPEGLAKHIVEPGAKELELLTHYTLSHIQYSIDLAVPDYQTCLEMVDNDSFGLSMTVHKNLGVSLRAPNIDKRLANNSGTIYERNNMTVDVFHENFSEGTTIKTLTESCIRTTNGMIDRFHHIHDMEEVAKFHGQRPIQEVMTGIIGDGAPAFAFSALKEESANGDNSLGQAAWFVGGFHFMLELLKCIGNLFRETRGATVSLYRKTQGQFNWTMFPGDPTDSLNELIPTIIAYYRSASDSYAEINGLHEVAPADVHAHMLERAHEHNLALFILLEIRFSTLVMMTRDAEKAGNRGDVNLFVACLRLALPLFSVTNAYRYLRTTCDFLKWWELASPAEKTIFEEFLYTRITSNGLPIWSDRCMEWTMGQIREFIGKCRRKGHDAKLYQIIEDLPNRTKNSTHKNLKEWRKLFMSPDIADEGFGELARDWNKQKLAGAGVTKIFALAYVQLRRMNVWGEGPPLIDWLALDNSIPDDLDTLDDWDEDVFRAPSGSRLDIALLDAYQEGIRRCSIYFEEFYIRNPNSVHRKTDRVEINAIPSTSVRTTTQLEQQVIFQTSTDPWELDNLPNRAFPKAHFIAEATDLKALLDAAGSDGDAVGIVLPNGAAAKRVWIQVLCRLREEYFKEFPDSLDIRFQTAARSDNTVCLKDKRSQILANTPFLSLDPSFCNERYLVSRPLMFML